MNVCIVFVYVVVVIVLGSRDPARMGSRDDVAAPAKKTEVQEPREKADAPSRASKEPRECARN